MARSAISLDDNGKKNTHRAGIDGVFLSQRDNFINTCNNDELSDARLLGIWLLLPVIQFKMMYEYPKVKTECLINGKVVIYDACHEGDKERADKFYGDNFRYIGSSNTYYINGTKNVSKKLTHFYVKAFL